MRRRELSEFERSMSVSASHIGYSTSESVGAFDIHQYKMPRETGNTRKKELQSTVTVHRSERLPVLNDIHQRRLARVVCGNRQATLAQITSTFNVESVRHVFCKSVQRYLVSMDYRNRRTLTRPRDVANWTLEYWQRDAL